MKHNANLHKEFPAGYAKHNGISNGIATLSAAVTLSRCDFMLRDESFWEVIEMCC
jgi:hypothetical protein